MSDPLWQRILVAGVGPVVTAGLALGVVNLVTGWAQRRRESWDVRAKLALEMSESANALYLAGQAFWRVANTHGIPVSRRHTAEEIKDARDALSTVYKKTRLQFQVIATQLEMYFKATQTSQNWHQVIDLLSARYFLLVDGDRERRNKIRERNAGPDHSGLSVDELKRPKALLDAYRAALSNAISGVWTAPIDWTGAGLRDRGPRPLHLPPSEDQAPVEE